MILLLAFLVSAPLSTISNRDGESRRFGSQNVMETAWLHHIL